MHQPGQDDHEIMKDPWVRKRLALENPPAFNSGGQSSSANMVEHLVHQFEEPQPNFNPS